MSTENKQNTGEKHPSYKLGKNLLTVFLYAHFESH